MSQREWERIVKLRGDKRKWREKLSRGHADCEEHEQEKLSSLLLLNTSTECVCPWPSSGRKRCRTTEVVQKILWKVLSWYLSTPTTALLELGQTLSHLYLYVGANRSLYSCQHRNNLSHLNFSSSNQIPATIDIKWFLYACTVYVCVGLYLLSKCLASEQLRALTTTDAVTLVIITCWLLSARPATKVLRHFHGIQTISFILKSSSSSSSSSLF